MPYRLGRTAHYLICDPHLFIAEGRLVRHGPHPERDVWPIDALVVDPWQKVFWLGDVTYDPKPIPLVRKVNRFYERIDEVIKRLPFEGLSGDWCVRPWLFIRHDAVPFLLAKLCKDCYPKITYVEETASPWKYESIRQQGKEPKKTYSDLDEKYQY